jgi:hypothetical protein
MSTTGDLLSNAERLISDAEYLHAEGRARSAATLIVVALEQLGAFVEVLTREKYPEATVHMGIFGSNANAHAKRQDALAAHVMNFAFGNFMVKVYAKKFLQGSLDGEDFGSWLIRTGPYELSQKEQLEQRQCPDIAAAHILMHLVRTKRLKDLREFGLYENTDTKFADEEIRKTIGLASRIREILSRSWVTPEVMQLVGVNMPEGIQPVGRISKA